MRMLEVSRVKFPDWIPLGLEADQTGPVNDWLAILPNGPGPLLDLDGDRIVPEGGDFLRGVTVIEWGGPVRVDGTVNLVGRSDLVFVNFNIVRVAWPMLAPQLVLDHCAFLRFVDPYVQGSKAPGWTYQAKREVETAYRFEGSQYVELIRPRAEQVWGDHLYFGKTNRNPALTRNVTVTDGIFGESGRDPVAATACMDVTVTGCTFGNGRTCVDLEPNGAQGGVYRTTIEECTFAGSYTGLFVAAVGGSDVGVVDGVTIALNAVEHGSIQTRVAGGERRANFTVQGNTGTQSIGNSVGIDGNRGCVMWFDGVRDQVTVTGNANPVNSGRGMLVARFNDCDQVTYEGNIPG